MRVIAGEAKGRRLVAPKGYDIRPTADRVKESIYNILGTAPQGALVLDLFAGSGNLGIEALSRGASKAYFIDSKRQAIELIRKNLEVTGLAERAEIIQSEAERIIPRLSEMGAAFDLIFLDPPYRISVSQVGAVIEKLASCCMNDGAMLVYEHDSKVNPLEIVGLAFISTRSYGDTAVSFYRKEG